MNLSQANTLTLEPEVPVVTIPVADALSVAFPEDEPLFALTRAHKGMTTKPGVCCDCGKDLPVPRTNNKVRCDECSHKKDLARATTWRSAQPKPCSKIRCAFKGGADLPEEYRARYTPPERCLVNFDRTNPREKYCDNCKEMARKWQQLQAAIAKYAAAPAKAAKRALENRHKRAIAAGRAIRALGQMYPCQYRDKDGKPGEACLGQFTATSAAQKYCYVCQLRVDAKRAAQWRANKTAQWRKEHPEEAKARSLARWRKLAVELPEDAEAKQEIQKLLFAMEPALTEKRGRGKPKDEAKQELFKRAASNFAAGGRLKTWTLVAKQVCPDEFKKDPKATTDRVRQARNAIFHPCTS